MSSILKVDEIQNTTGKTGLVITPDGTVTVPSVKFPEQSNPSGRVITSTTMSSYEEGTWNPELVTGDARFLEAKYTKINSLVQLRVYLDNITDKTSSDEFAIVNLPFAPLTDSEASVSACMFRYIAIPNDYTSIVGYLLASGQISIYFTGSGNYQRLEHRNISDGNSNIRLDFTYYTDE